jgi:hypothetical protein
MSALKPVSIACCGEGFHVLRVLFTAYFSRYWLNQSNVSKHLCIQVRYVGWGQLDCSPVQQNLSRNMQEISALLEMLLQNFQF